MSVLQIRGGFPHVFREDITTTGQPHRPKKQINYLQVYTLTNPVKVYFTQDDFDNDQNYVLVPVPALEDMPGWEGPVELADYQNGGPTIWFKGSGGTASITAVFYQRRG